MTGGLSNGSTIKKQKPLYVGVVYAYAEKIETS